MKLNNIQQQIYNEYKMTGRVIAECPRQCGKTSIICGIITEEIIKGNKVNVFTTKMDWFKSIKERVFKLLPIERKELLENILYENVINFEELTIYDEKFPYHINEGTYVALWTRPYEIMQFTYKDMKEGDKPFISKDNLKEHKKRIGNKQWNIEFNGGIINEHN